MRRASDKLCRERGLSVIDAPEQGRAMSYDAWEAGQRGKYIAVRPPGKERFVRLKTLGG